MNAFFRILVFTAIIMGVAACQEDGSLPGDTLSINPGTLTFAADQTGVTKSVSVTASGDWTFSWEEDWITVTKSNNTLSVSINTVNTGDISRNAAVKITSGLLEKTLTVTQLGQDEVPVPGELTINPTTLPEFAANGSTPAVTITVTTPLPTSQWTATGENWITVNYTGDYTFTVAVTENGTNGVRNGTVTVASDGQTKTLAVSQAAAQSGGSDPADDFVGTWTVSGYYYNIDHGDEVLPYTHDMTATKVDENTVSFFPVFDYENLYASIPGDPWHYEQDGETVLVTINDDGTVNIPFQQLTPTWGLYTYIFDDKVYFARMISDDVSMSVDAGFENVPVNNYTIELFNENFIPKKPNGVTSLTPYRGSYWNMGYNKMAKKYLYCEGMFLDIVWTKQQ